MAMDKHTARRCCAARAAVIKHIQTRDRKNVIYLDRQLPGDQLDNAADLIADLLHYMESKGLITTYENGEDLVMRAYRNWRAER